ncbi:MAG: endonuclease MutS2 [Ruminococcaceae bacterium]|nr:endonuclease MutS2 [Oscillospiraceae bacterium]
MNRIFEHAAKRLEFDKVLEKIAECCAIESGAQKIREIMPETDISAVRLLQRQTSDAKKMLSVKGAPTLSAHPTVPQSISRAEKGAQLNAQELLRIASMLSSAGHVAAFGEALEESNSLYVIFNRLIPNKALCDDINRAIISEDMIADDASDKLFEIRKKIRLSGARIRETLQKYTGGAFSSYLQENIVTIRNGRYVIPVRAEYRNEIKGLVHDTSSSRATVFIEPLPVVELNNEIKLLENEEREEIERILNVFSRRVEGFSEALYLDFYNIVEISTIFAKAEYSFRSDAVEPSINEGTYTNLKKARHPLLDKTKVVPINISLGKQFDTLVITGPNTGGKTVSIKTLALLAMMAQSGIHIPADEESTVCIYTDILCDIGDEQSIEQSLSTFSSHMVNIVSMLENTKPGALLVFDELGAGTDPVEGAALAIAILERVRSLGAKCLATTHYPELKSYALSTERVENASCEFDVNSLKPTYRLIMGTPGRSNAFLISERLGLSSDIINAASEFIDSESLRFEKVVEKLESDRIAMEDSLRSAEKARIEAAEAKKTAMEERKRLLDEAEKELERAKAEAIRLVKTAKMQSENVMAQLDELQKKQAKELDANELEAKRNEFRESLRLTGKIIDESKLADDNDGYTPPRAFAPGDRVLVAIGSKRDNEGVIEKIKGGEAYVLCGSIKTKVKLDSLRLITELENASKKPLKSATASARPIVKAEIDVRGDYVEDAWFKVDKYLDDAVLAGLGSVSIIHGKGTGALRKGLLEYLKRDKRVKQCRMGAYGEGDSGVTVVTLK